MAPPPRPAHLFQQHNGLSREAAQMGLLHRLGLFAGIDFTGDVEGALSPVAEDSTGALRAPFVSNRGEGVLELSAAPDGWVKAEVISGAKVVFRAWIEDPYEEREGWPDRADGVGEGPLRISKRGSWLVIEAARFPGVPADENGYFRLEEAGR